MDICATIRGEFEWYGFEEIKLNNSCVIVTIGIAPT